MRRHLDQTAAVAGHTFTDLWERERSPISFRVVLSSIPQGLKILDSSLELRFFDIKNEITSNNLFKKTYPENTARHAPDQCTEQDEHNGGDDDSGGCWIHVCWLLGVELEMKKLSEKLQRETSERECSELWRFKIRKFKVERNSKSSADLLHSIAFSKLTLKRYLNHFKSG